MASLILRLDVTGHPVAWLSRQAAAVMYCKEQVAWEAGDTTFALYGGTSRMTGERSRLDISTIVATRGVSRVRAMHAPALTNARLFRRDRHTCMYCGDVHSARELTRDHVHPLSLGGRDRWENVVTACRRCNQRKDSRTQAQAEEIGLRLLAVPYRPNRAEGLLLANRHVLADQMSFLSARVGRDSRFLV